MKRSAFLWLDDTMLPLWIITSFGELSSGVPLRFLMILQSLASSSDARASSIRSLQLWVFASLMASFVSLQAWSHSLLLSFIYLLSLFLFLMAALTVGDHQHLARAPGLVLPTCSMAFSFRRSVNIDTLEYRDSLCSKSKMDSSNLTQSTLLDFH